MEIITNQTITKYHDDTFTEEKDLMAVEFPLTIYINDIEFATLVCTPDYLEDLVIGFLASEGVIRSFNDIKTINIDDRSGLCHIESTREINPDFFQFTKRVLSSCCGKSRQFYFQNDMQMSKISNSEITLTPGQVLALQQELQESSDIFKETGGIHNASISSPDGMLLHRGDIGRHNALDKLYGYFLRNKMPVHDKVLVFSGRISSEILTKASKIGVGLVLSKAAPTDLAIKLADDLNITAIGFIRKNSFNVYSHPWRIQK